jgi:hypothetical protein
MELCLRTWVVLKLDIGNWILINFVSWLFLVVALVALVVLVGLEALLVEEEFKVVVLVVVLVQVEIETGPSFHGNNEF